MAEEKVTLSKVLKKLSNVAGFKDLSPNQMKTRLASLSQSAIKNAIKLAKFKGGAAIAAIELVVRLGPEPTRTSQGADPLNLFGPRRKDKVDKAAVEAAVKEANKVDTSSKLAPDQSQRPVTRDKKKKSEETSQRPVTRDTAKNMMYGGMAKAKPRTGSTDYRMGGMFMKNGKK
jgi:hypothetical protein|tara:strand:+ start:763 stop:1284 length:522 start_codon:yes stop_codon:yes gene_type:complete